MNQPDLKKFITAFLVLAVISSTGALVLSRFLPTDANTQPQTQPISLKNAFLPNALSDLSSGTSLGNQNLTQNLADNIAQSLINTNPSGPQNVSGTSSIIIPGNINDVVSNYLTDISTTSISQPKIDESRLQIIKSATPTDLINYFSALQPILSPLDSQQVKSLNDQAQNGNGSQVLDSISLLYSGIETKLYNLKTPDSALRFHKDLITLIDLVPTTLEVGANGDPLEAVLTLNNSRAILESTQLDILKEFDLIKLSLPQTIGYREPSGLFSVLETRKAYAGGIPVIDILNWILNHLTNVYTSETAMYQTQSWYSQILTEQLKDKLLKLVVNSILNWARGGGPTNPGFVTNWNDFLKNSYVNAANIAISQATAGVCEPFRTQIQLQLYALYGESSIKGVLKNPSLSDLQTCTLQQTVSNLDAFNADFNQGGWAGYLALTDPTQNPYGSLYITAQQADQAGQRGQDSAKTSAQSNGGFISTYKCADGSTASSDGICANGDTAEVTTPGSVIGQSTSKAVTSAIDRIVNANNWESLATQLAQFAITKLVSAGVNGILYGSVTGTQQSTNPTDQYASCSGYQVGSSDYLNCIQSVNNVTSSTNNNQNQTILLNQTQQALQDAKSASDALSIALDAASSTIQILNSVASSTTQCPSESTTAQNELPGLDQEYGDLSNKLTEITQQISDLNDFMTGLQNHDPQDQEFFTQALIQFQTQFGGAAVFAQENGDAQAQASDLQNKFSDASTLLQQCLAH